MRGHLLQCDASYDRCWRSCRSSSLVLVAAGRPCRALRGRACRVRRRLARATPARPSTPSLRAAIRARPASARSAGRRAADVQRRTEERPTSRPRTTSCSTRRPASRSSTRSAGRLDNVIVNNRLRSVLDAAIGALTLCLPDPARRWTRRRPCSSRADPRALPASGQALATERDPASTRTLTQTRAADHLTQRETRRRSTRIAPSPIIRDRGDQDCARRLLDGLPAEPAAGGARGGRAIAASASIQRHARAAEFVQNALYGLSLGSVLLLAAIGLAITFGVMGVINMAHGEMVMIGAYATFVVQRAFRTYVPGAFDCSLVVAVPVAFIVARRGRHRHRAQHHPLPLWPPAGNAARHLGAVADPAAGGAHAFSGRTNKEVGNPSWMSGGFESRRHRPSPITGSGSSSSRLLVFVAAARHAAAPHAARPQRCGR